jgi:4-amino-4-deoxy-L-arabinose transferase-like glycosyltransferase
VFASPRLVARDQRHLTQGTSVAAAADLRQIVSFETGHPFGVTSEEAYLSWEARRRRQAYFYFMCMLCIFPFIAPLVYRGTFDSGLSWYTRGETGQLSQRQRRNVLIVGCFFSAVWLVVLAVFVTVIVNNSKLHHNST